MWVEYFAYGSNLHLARMRERVPEARVVGSATLQDHRLVFDKRGRDGSAKANIEPSPGGRVLGAVYRLPREQLTTLDGFEGGYVRVLVTVSLRSGETRECQTYFCENGTPGLRPADWYRELIVTGAREHGLPDEYVAEIEALCGSAGPK